MLAYGYPQNCAIDLMKQLIRLGKASNEVEEDVKPSVIDDNVDRSETTQVPDV